MNHNLTFLISLFIPGYWPPYRESATLITSFIYLYTHVRLKPMERTTTFSWEAPPSTPYKDSEELSFEEKREKHLLAGKTAVSILKKLNEECVVGAKLLDLTLMADKMIEDAGLLPAFPLNISINEEAAHYTCDLEDRRAFKKGDVVKFDVGVQADGYIADTAFTKDLSKKNSDLVKATEEATQAVIDVIRPGTNTQQLGALIEDIIRGYDLNPVRDLAGHSIERYSLHAGKSVPMVGGRKGEIVVEGDAFAVETFASTGPGESRPDYNRIPIYRVLPIKRPIRSKAGKAVKKIGLKIFYGLPIAKRWLDIRLTPSITNFGIRELLKVGVIHEYQVLVDRPGSYVSQKEHTMLIGSDGAEVMTNW